MSPYFNGDSITAVCGYDIRCAMVTPNFVREHASIDPVEIVSQRVLGLHSKSPVYTKYLEDPSLVAQYPVLIVTHAKLVQDPPQILY